MDRQAPAPEQEGVGVDGRGQSMVASTTGLCGQERQLGEREQAVAIPLRRETGVQRRDRVVGIGSEGLVEIQSRQQLARRRARTIAVEGVAREIALHLARAHAVDADRRRTRRAEQQERNTDGEAAPSSSAHPLAHVPPSNSRSGTDSPRMRLTSANSRSISEKYRRRTRR